MKTNISRLLLSTILAAGVSLAACDAPADENAGTESNVAPQAGEFYSPIAPAPGPAPEVDNNILPPGSRGNEGGGEPITGGTVSSDPYGGVSVDGNMGEPGVSSGGMDGGAMPEPGVAAGSDGSMGETSPGGADVTESELPQSDVPPPSREVFADAECNFEAWVGKPVDEAAVKATGRPYRIHTPNSMMTMDHSPQRINVEHEEGGTTVTRVWCG